MQDVCRETLVAGEFNNPVVEFFFVFKEDATLQFTILVSCTLLTRPIISLRSS